MSQKKSNIYPAGQSNIKIMMRRCEIIFPLLALIVSDLVFSGANRNSALVLIHTMY